MKWLPLLMFPLALLGGLNENGDFQVWNTDTINLQMGKKTFLKGETEFRYGRDGSKLYYKHYQGGIVFIRSSHTIIETSYRHIFLRVDHHWRKIYSPFLDLTFQAQSKRGWYIGNRNRIQYLIHDKHLGSKRRWLYRNRFEIILPHRVTRRKIAPYVANEFFWHEARGISENRLEAGLKIPYHQRTQLNLAYMSRNLKNHKKNWIHQNVTWIHFSLHF